VILKFFDRVLSTLAQSFGLMKRLFVVSVLLCIIALACTKRAGSGSAINAIPLRSALVVRINNLSDFAGDVEISIPGRVIRNSLIFKDLQRFAGLMGQLQGEREAPIKAFGGYQMSGAGTYGWVWSLEEARTPFLSEQALSTTGEVTGRAFSGADIYHYTGTELDFYFANTRGLVILSTHENLVEDALKQLSANIDLTQDKHFMNVLKTVSAKDPINVFVNYPALPDWLATIVTDKPTWIGDLGTWAALDLDINENDINFTGITLVPDSAANYAGLFAGTGAGSVRFEQIIPQNAALVVNQTCGDFTAWSSNFATYLGKHNRLKKRNNKLTEMGIDAKAWATMIDEEMGIYYTDGALSSQNSKCGYLRVSDVESALQSAQAVSKTVEDNYRNFTIYQLEKRNALSLLYGRLFSYMPQPYWFVHEQWVVFGNDLSVVKTHINNIIGQKTWANSVAYSRIDALRDDDAHLIAMAKNPELLKLAQKELTKELGETVEESIKELSQINWVLVQFKQRSDAAYTELVLQHQTKQEGSTKHYWSVQLDAPAISRPQLVQNHYSKANEVIIQDEAHNLYLIDPEGNVLWKKPLDGPILGEITQVDLYKNNKLQLAFNTPQRLYIVDRNGKDVAPFPLQLPGQSTAPMGVFDYAKNRDYRFVVACGNRLYNYNGNGKKVKGWNVIKAKAKLVDEPKHSTIGTKDFIYTRDMAGNVYVLNRRGDIRVPLKNKIRHTAGELYLEGSSPASAKLTALSKSGYQINVYFNDNIDSLQPFGNEPQYMNKLGSRSAFAGDDELYFRSAKSNFDAELENPITQRPGIFIAGGQLYISATCGEEVFVFDGLGNQLPGMPLYGSGQAIVGRTGGKTVHVIVAAPDGTLQDYKLVAAEE
jgi:hypothetical protein